MLTTIDDVVLDAYLASIGFTKDSVELTVMDSVRHDLIEAGTEPEVRLQASALIRRVFEGSWPAMRKRMCQAIQEHLTSEQMQDYTALYRKHPLLVKDTLQLQQALKAVMSDCIDEWMADLTKER